MLNFKRWDERWPSGIQNNDTHESVSRIMSSVCTRLLLIFYSELVCQVNKQLVYTKVNKQENFFFHTQTENAQFLVWNFFKALKKGRVKLWNFKNIKMWLKDLSFFFKNYP